MWLHSNRTYISFASVKPEKSNSGPLMSVLDDSHLWGKPSKRRLLHAKPWYSMSSVVLYISYSLCVLFGLHV